MANVLVRNVPDDIHLVLQRRAELKGLSLQQYLSAELKRLATKPSIEEVLDGIERHRNGQVGLAQAAEDVSAERTQR
jgi:plasmid stability protein